MRYRVAAGLFLITLVGVWVAIPPSRAPIVTCVFGYMGGYPNAYDYYNPGKYLKPSFSHSSIDSILSSNEHDVFINFHENTIGALDGMDGPYTYRVRVMKSDHVYIAVSDIQFDTADTGEARIQWVIIYYPTSQTAVRLARTLTKKDIEAEQEGVAPFQQNAEAILRLDPHLTFDIGPCRNATQEEINEMADPDAAVEPDGYDKDLG